MVDDQQRIYNKRYVRYIIFVTLVVILMSFVLGVLLGRSLANVRTTQLQRFMMNSELNTESFLIAEELIDDFDEHDCELANNRIDFLTRELGETGRMLVAAEMDSSLSPADFKLMKRKHHLMQTKTYLLLYDFMKYCHIDRDIILYYYGANDTYSKDQGIILDGVVKDYGATVFAMEYNYSDDARFMEEFYLINQTPSLVVNYETILSGLTDYDTIVGSLARD